MNLDKLHKLSLCHFPHLQNGGGVVPISQGCYKDFTQIKMGKVLRRVPCA